MQGGVHDLSRKKGVGIDSRAFVGPGGCFDDPTPGPNVAVLMLGQA